MTPLQTAPPSPASLGGFGDPAGLARLPAQWGAHVSLSLMLGLGVVCMFDASILGALLTPIKHTLQLSDEQFGRAAGIFTFAGMIGAPLFGWLANRFTRKRTLFAGIVIWSIASIGSGLAGGLAALLLWRGLTGFGEAAYQVIAPSWLADLYRPKWRNFVFSLYMLRNKVGAALAFAAGGWLASHYDWQTAFFVSGLPGIALALALLLIREPRPGASEQAGAMATAPRGLHDGLPRGFRGELRRGFRDELPRGLRDGLVVFRSPAYVLHCVALSLFFLGMCTQMWVPAYLTRSFDVANQAASGFLSAVLLCTLPAGMIGGYLSSLLLRERPGGFAALLSVTSSLTAVIFLFAYTSPDLATAKLLIVVAVATFGFSAGTLTTLIVETVAPALRSSATSFAVLITGGIPGIVGPELIGVFSDRYGLRTALCLGLLGYALAAVVWAGLAAWQRRDGRGRAAA